MKILLLSAYDAASHRSWREGLVGYFCEHSFVQLTLSPRFFSWRIRGNSLSFAHSLRSLDIDFDLVIATSMVDLSTLVGMVPELAGVPTLVYFHENQFEFPNSPKAYPSLEPQLVNLYSAIAASHICFNSEYNFHSFCVGVERLLSRFPDEVPPGIVESISAKSSVLPVPLAADVFEFQISDTAKKPGSIVWNHRWEYDKGTDRLLAAVKLLPSDKAFTFHIIGQRFKVCPTEMDELQSVLSSRGWLGSWGPVESRNDYLDVLGSSQFVMSTAIHDFQGLSVLEAMALGCLPIVPDRLAYQEYVQGPFRYPSSLSDPAEEARACATMLSTLTESAGVQQQNDASHSDLCSFSWPELGPRYHELMRELVDS